MLTFVVTKEHTTMTKNEMVRTPQEQELQRRLMNFYRNSFWIGSGVTKEFNNAPSVSLWHFNKEADSELRLDVVEAAVPSPLGRLAIGVMPFSETDLYIGDRGRISLPSDFSQLLAPEGIGDEQSWRAQTTDRVLELLSTFHDTVTNAAPETAHPAQIRIHDQPSLVTLLDNQSSAH